MSAAPSSELPAGFCWAYALWKQLPTAYAIASNYGGIELDDELRGAIDTAVRPILTRRLELAGHPPREEDAPTTVSVPILNLSPADRATLSVFIACHHQHDAQTALLDLIRRGLREIVSEGADEEEEL